MVVSMMPNARIERLLTAPVVKSPRHLSASPPEADKWRNEWLGALLLMMDDLSQGT